MDLVGFVVVDCSKSCAWTYWRSGLVGKSNRQSSSVSRGVPRPVPRPPTRTGGCEAASAQCPVGGAHHQRLDLGAEAGRMVPRLSRPELAPAPLAAATACNN